LNWLPFAHFGRRGKGDEGKFAKVGCSRRGRGEVIDLYSLFKRIQYENINIWIKYARDFIS
jgi:hypothetical protein